MRCSTAQSRLIQTTKMTRRVAGLLFISYRAAVRIVDSKMRPKPRESIGAREGERRAQTLLPLGPVAGTGFDPEVSAVFLRAVVVRPEGQEREHDQRPV